MLRRIPKDIGVGYMCKITKLEDIALYEKVARMAEDDAQKDLTNLGFMRALMLDYAKHRERAK
jgi:hypothetical protein